MVIFWDMMGCDGIYHRNNVGLSENGDTPNSLFFLGWVIHIFRQTFILLFETTTGDPGNINITISSCKEYSMIAITHVCSQMASTFMTNTSSIAAFPSETLG